MTMPCIVLGQPLLLGLLHAYTIMGFKVVASTGSFVSCPFLVTACSDFYSLDWLSSVASCSWPFAGGRHVARADRVCMHDGSVAVADDMHMSF